MCQGDTFRRTNEQQHIRGDTRKVGDNTGDTQSQSQGGVRGNETAKRGRHTHEGEDVAWGDLFEEVKYGFVVKAALSIFFFTSRGQKVCGSFYFRPFLCGIASCEEKRDFSSYLCTTVVHGTSFMHHLDFVHTHVGIFYTVWPFIHKKIDLFFGHKQVPFSKFFPRWRFS